MTFALIIPTFHRAEALKRRLFALQDQTVDPSAILVVDNSGDRETSTAIAEASSSGRWPIRHLRTPENIGPAGATALGMTIALADYPNLDWIGRGDDDGPALPHDHFAVLLRCAETLHEAGQPLGGVGTAGACWDARRARLLKPVHNPGGHQFVDYLATGFYPLYSTEAVRDVGPFRADLFFGYTEVEFGLRLRRAGHLLARVDRPEHARKYGSPSASIVAIDWRRYYSIRNEVIIAGEFGNRGAAVRRSLARFAKGAINLPLRPRQSWQLLCITARAVLDARAGRLGRRVEPLVRGGRLDARSAQP